MAQGLCRMQARYGALRQQRIRSVFFSQGRCLTATEALDILRSHNPRMFQAPGKPSPATTPPPSRPTDLPPGAPERSAAPLLLPRPPRPSAVVRWKHVTVPGESEGARRLAAMESPSCPKTSNPNS